MVPAREVEVVALVVMAGPPLLVVVQEGPPLLVVVMAGPPPLVVVREGPPLLVVVQEGPPLLVVVREGPPLLVVAGPTLLVVAQRQVAAAAPPLEGAELKESESEDEFRPPTRPPKTGSQCHPLSSPDLTSTCK